jgi:Arc/MetJ-type ribon-helix-helix transcriptional regulator
VSGKLHAHIEQQVGESGLYENASEYIRSLIRRDLQTHDDAWDWLRRHLEPAMRADENEFIEATAADVIRRNRGG